MGVEKLPILLHSFTRRRKVVTGSPAQIFGNLTLLNIFNTMYLSYFSARGLSMTERTEDKLIKAFLIGWTGLAIYFLYQFNKAVNDFDKDFQKTFLKR